MTGTATSRADASTGLAVDRTRLAYERTMMAWVRTGTSLISFGFTIYKFFQYQIERGEAAATGRLIGPRGFAVIMISIGLVALIMAAIDHRRSMQRLRATYGAQPRSTAAAVAVLVSVLGLLALAAALFGA